MALKRSTVRFRYAPVFVRPNRGDRRLLRRSLLWGAETGLASQSGSRDFTWIPALLDYHSTSEKLMAAEGQELAIACAKAAEEILAEEIRVLDLRGISSLTDYMVVCSGSSMPHLKAILREVEVKVRAWSGADPLYSEGKADSRWVVLDYVDVMVHIMHQEMRELYALEELWGDAKIVEWEPNRAPSK